MLRFLRKYSGSTGIKILYGVLAGLFIIWGVGAVGGQRMDVVARVHGEPISRHDLDRAAAILQRRYEDLFKGAHVPPILDLRARALDQLIDDALVRHEAARLGLEVTGAELVAAITTMPEFQENGRFNRDLLERMLRVQRDRGEFEDQLRRSILTQRLQSLVTDGAQVSDAEVEERYRLDHEQVNLAFVRIPAADLARTVTLTDEELQKYLPDHPDRYRLPTRVRVRYAVYRPADFAAQVQASEEEIADYYNQHRDDRFQEREQVHARHILIRVPPGATDDAKATARKKAEEVLAKAKAGEDMAALAKKYSQDAISAPKGGDLGFLPRGRMPTEFDEAAFALQPGQVSDLVESPSGFHIIKVEERGEAGPKPIEAVRDEIADVLRKERGLELARRQADTDRREVVRGKPFTEAVGGRKVEETALFAATDDVPDVGRVPAFTQAAFALGQGEVSDLVETDDAVYLLTPAERVEAYVPPLDEVRERVTADARQDRGAALARERGEALRKHAQEIGLEKAAAEAGLTVEETGSFEHRTGVIPKIGAAGDLRTDAFALTPETPLAPRVYAAAGDAIVAALRERTPADMSGFAAARDGLQQSLLQQKRFGLLTAYMNFLKERAQREGALDVRVDALGRG